MAGPPPFNWSALRQWDPVLVRRVGDLDQWVIGVGHAGEGAVDAGRMIALDYGWPAAVDPAPEPAAEHTGPWTMIWRPAHLFLADSTGVRCLDHAPPNDQVRTLCSPATPSVPPMRRGPARTWQLRTHREDYLRRAERIAAHLHRGDIYELNYCVERWCIDHALDPLATFVRLLQRTDAPHAAFLRHGDRYAICMSPERFLRVDGGMLLTQPMKGTRPRVSDPADDRRIARHLQADPKERSENIMAVDVARNDLGRVAVPGSVQVPELCTLRTLPNVHQLVSTVSARLAPGRSAWDAVRAAFPMASMTGAPKPRAMEIIAGLEDTRRGLYSGALGFELPDGTLDLNVVIRTITYDAGSGRASLITGGAFTAQSDPLAEWAECTVKARSILDALGDEG